MLGDSWSTPPRGWRTRWWSWRRSVRRSRRSKRARCARCAAPTPPSASWPPRWTRNRCCTGWTRFVRNKLPVPVSRLPGACGVSGDGDVTHSLTNERDGPLALTCEAQRGSGQTRETWSKAWFRVRAKGYPFLAPFSSAFYLVRMLSNKPKPRLTRCSALRINYSTTGWLEATVSLITQTHPNSC